MILSDREIAQAIDNNWLVIDPRPGVEFMDSTTVDLTLGGELNRWEFPAPDKALANMRPCSAPGIQSFGSANLSVGTPDGSTLMGPDSTCTRHTCRRPKPVPVTLF